MSERTSARVGFVAESSVARTYVTYGMWADELGQRAANLREGWAVTDGGAPRQAEGDA